MHSLFRFLLACSIMVITTGGWAQDGEQLKRFFERLDANGDGVIALEEVPAERKDQFERLMERIDKNKDGKVSMTEFMSRFRGDNANQPKRPDGQRPGASRTNAARRSNQNSQSGNDSPKQSSRVRGTSSAPIFRLLDENQDGQLSTREIEKIASVLVKLDRNGDSQVSMQEILAAVNTQSGNRPFRPSTQYARPPRTEGDSRPRRPSDDSTRPIPPTTRSGAAGTGMAGILKRLDKNNDGKVSKDEIPTMLRRRFADLDENDDGILNPPELKKLIEMGRSRRPQTQGFSGRSTRSNPQVAQNREAIAQFMRDNDADADGQISEKETPDKFKDKFRELDRDDNGFLNAAELVGVVAPRP